MTIAERIFKIMDEKNIKYVDLSNKLGVNKSVVSTWKSRNKNPPAEYLVQICELLGVSLKYLLDGKEPAPSSSSLSESDKLILSKVQGLTEIDKAQIAGILGYLIDTQLRQKAGAEAPGPSDLPQLAPIIIGDDRSKAKEVFINMIKSER